MRDGAKSQTSNVLEHTKWRVGLCSHTIKRNVSEVSPLHLEACVPAIDGCFPQPPSTPQAKKSGVDIPVENDKNASNSAPQLPAQRPPHADDAVQTPNASRKRLASPSAQTSPPGSDRPAPKSPDSKTSSSSSATKRIRGVLVKWMGPESMEGVSSASAPKLQRVLTFGEDKIIHGAMSQAFCATTHTAQPPQLPAQDQTAGPTPSSPR
jgi:hypothetical protein